MFNCGKVALLAILCITLLCATSAADNKGVPSIGYPSLAIFTSPLEMCSEVPEFIKGQPSQKKPNSCVNGNYVRWIEAAGVRVVPLYWNSTFDEIDTIMTKVNGVLFAGGGLDAFPSRYNDFFKQAQRVYTNAKNFNDNGDRFVLWGTCQGFQMMSALGAGTLDVIVNHFYTGVVNRMLPLTMTSKQPSSRLLGTATTPTSILNMMTTQNTTLNMHRDGVPPSSYNDTSKLGQAFNVLSTNFDDNQHEFVSSMEHKHYPFFGTQWHPEWPPFVWSDSRFSKSASTSDVSQHMAQFLRDQLLQSAHRFDSPEDIEDVVIEQHALEYVGWGFEQFWIGVPNSNANKYFTNVPEEKKVEKLDALSGFIGALFGAIVAVGVSYYIFAVKGIGRRSVKREAYNAVEDGEAAVNAQYDTVSARM